jgi:hypothetical protein
MMTRADYPAGTARSKGAELRTVPKLAIDSPRTTLFLHPALAPASWVRPASLSARQHSGSCGKLFWRAEHPRVPDQSFYPGGVYTRGVFVGRFYDEIICGTMGSLLSGNIDADGSRWRPADHAGPTFAANDGRFQPADFGLAIRFTIGRADAGVDFYVDCGRNRRSDFVDSRDFDRRLESSDHAWREAG